MGFSEMMMRRKSRGVWSDSHRMLLTLESFARTEADGGRDIATAARRVDDPELKNHLERHAEDELKHAELFRRRARELRTGEEFSAEEADVASDKAYDLTRGRPSDEVDAHGFFKVGLLDELGEVPYVAMLHVAEQKAAALFHVHHDLTRDDPATHAIFEEILRDENYHVAWTRAVLDRWTEEGRDEEVRAAMKAARTSRFMGAWKRAGLRAGAGFGKVLMYLFYWTLMLPFGLFGRLRGDRAPGWKPPPVGRPGEDALARVRSQA